MLGSLLRGRLTVTKVALQLRPGWRSNDGDRRAAGPLRQSHCRRQRRRDLASRAAHGTAARRPARGVQPVRHAHTRRCRPTYPPTSSPPRRRAPTWPCGRRRESSARWDSPPTNCGTSSRTSLPTSSTRTRSAPAWSPPRSGAGDRPSSSMCATSCRRTPCRESYAGSCCAEPTRSSPTPGTPCVRSWPGKYPDGVLTRSIHNPIDFDRLEHTSRRHDLRAEFGIAADASVLVHVGPDHSVEGAGRFGPHREAPARRGPGRPPPHRRRGTILGHRSSCGQPAVRRRASPARAVARVDGAVHFLGWRDELHASTAPPTSRSSRR